MNSLYIPVRSTRYLVPRVDYVCTLGQKSAKLRLLLWTLACRRYGADSSIPRAETARDTVFGIVIGIRTTRAIYPIAIPAFRVPCVRRGILTRLCSSARRQGTTASCTFYRLSIIPNTWIFGINESCEYVHSFTVL